MIEHYHTRTKTGRVPELNRLAPEAFVELHPADAARLEIAQGELVRVVSRRGQIEVTARITEGVSPGEVFVPFHFGEPEPVAPKRCRAANHLTAAVTDRFSAQPLLKVAACRLEKT